MSAQKNAGGIEPPAFLRADARVFWESLASTHASDQVGALRVARYCNALARFGELDTFLMRAGAAGTTYPVVGADGKHRGVRELPQATEYRRLLQLLLEYERAITNAQRREPTLFE